MTANDGEDAPEQGRQGKGEAKAKEPAADLVSVHSLAYRRHLNSLPLARSPPSSPESEPGGEYQQQAPANSKQDALVLRLAPAGSSMTPPPRPSTTARDEAKASSPKVAPAQGSARLPLVRPAHGPWKPLTLPAGAKMPINPPRPNTLSLSAPRETENPVDKVGSKAEREIPTRPEDETAQ